MIPTFEVLVAAAAELLAACREKRVSLATAESCTGGLVAAVLTEIPGSSDVLERGFVTYSNASKTELLDVPAELISRYGAVSEAVARAMASGALLHSTADIAVSVTGIAGPGGGTPEKPVGLVHLAAAERNRSVLIRQIRLGEQSRSAIRLASVAEAYAMISELVGARRASGLP
jgi:nicotinamide-nucleotide amidase